MREIEAERIKTDLKQRIDEIAIKVEKINAISIGLVTEYMSEKQCLFHSQKCFRSPTSKCL